MELSQSEFIAEVETTCVLAAGVLSLETDPRTAALSLARRSVCRPRLPGDRLQSSATTCSYSGYFFNGTGGRVDLFTALDGDKMTRVTGRT